MIRVSLTALAARRARTVLSALAVVLGVAMISAAFTFSDTLRHGADSLTSASYKGTDAVVVARTGFNVSQDGDASTPTVAQALLSQIRTLPQVAVAAGDVTNTQTRIIDARGATVGGGPFFGVGYDPSVPGAHRLTPFRLQSGHYASTTGEVVIDAGTASKHHLGLGETIRIAARGPVRSFTVSGIATFGSVKSIGDATFAVFDLPEAQHLFGESGRYDSILVAARPGVTPAALRTALTAAVPPTARVQSAAAQDRFTLTGLKHFISIISIVLLTFGGVAIFVGAFTIFNTLAITVAQRSRELAMLRTVGASRGQVLGSVMVEALVIGAVAAIIGVAAGLGLATALTSVLSSLGLDLPQSGTVFAARTAIVGLLLGVVVTALAGIAPALGATKVPPVLAIREGVVADASSGGWATRVGIVTAVLSLVLLLSGMFAAGVEVGARFALIIPGCLLLFLAVALLSGRIASRLASVLGRPAERLGGAAGGLARLSAMRTPARTASTAAALMVGVALVVFVSTIGAGLRQSTTGTIEHQIKATYVVAADDAASPIDPGVGAAVRGAAGVGGTSSIAQDQVRAYGQVVALNGVEPGTIAGAYRYAWKQGSDRVVAGLSGDGAIVDQSFARAHHLSVGSSLVAHVASGGSLRLVVRGVDVPPKWGALGLGPITVSRATLHATFPLARDRLTFVTVGHADAATLGSLRARLSSYPGVKVMTPHAFATQQMSWIARVIAIVYVLLALAVIVSLLGIVNTLALSVFERTRELGMLRAIGMTRRQVRRMVRHESVIMALFGASVGIAVGLFLAAMVTVALRGQGLQFALPSASLVAFVVIAVAAGMLAAIGPARRAARLRVLDALAYE